VATAGLEVKLRLGALVGPLFLLACAVGWPANTANAAVGSAIGAAVECAFAGAHVTVLSGPTGAGNYNVIIEVKNAPFEPCALPAYPTVDLFDAATNSYLVPTQSPDGPLGTGSTQPKTPGPITLPPGAVAAALLGGTEIPHDGAPTCPFFSSTVSLPGSNLPSHFDLPLPDCSGFTLGPFVLGFNGSAPTGAVAGTAPRCGPPSTPAGFGAAPVDAWHAGTLADFAQFATGGRRRYQMVLSPGDYRITSGRLRPRRIVVRAGTVVSIGRFGACRHAPSPSTPRTVPSRGMSMMPTTTTTTSAGSAAGSPGVTGLSSMPPCANNQLRTSALHYGAAGGAVSEVVAFTNTGSGPCSLTGYPGVAALNDRGLQVEQARRQLHAMLGGQFAGTQVQTVPLEPGQLASATVEGSDVPAGAGASGCPAYFPSLLVTAPNATTSVTLTSVGMQGLDFAEHGFPGCSPLVVTPVVPGTTGSPPTNG
jgi:hypothetical protein